MEIQHDAPVRTVALANLEAMCAHVSGRFSVESVSANRVKVSYSNPNEYGSEYPIVATFPCYPDFGGFGQPTTVVVLSILRTTTAPNWHGEEWQAFFPLLDCPKLWRNPQTNKWETEATEATS